jgi:AcrR family transcriptional regulator
LDILKGKGPQGMGINAIAKGRCFKTLIYRYFGGMKGLLLTLLKRRLLNLFWPLMKKKKTIWKFKSFIKRGPRASENVLAQEILRWQLIENNEDTKGLLSTSTQGWKNLR